MGHITLTPDNIEDGSERNGDGYNGGYRNDPPDPYSAFRNPLLSAEQLLLNELTKDIVYNELMSRSALVKKFFDPRRNINAECGYPDIIRPRDYQESFDRNGLANRVVCFEPLESWVKQPEVYESEDEEVETPFEEDWKNLDQHLSAVGTKENMMLDADNRMSPIWYYLRKADILSGIGSYGVILFGLNDTPGPNGTVDFSLPVQGYEEINSEPKDLYPGKYDPPKDKNGNIKSKRVRFADGSSGREYGPNYATYNEAKKKKVEEIINNMQRKEGGQYELVYNEEAAAQWTERKLLYLRCYPEYLAQVVLWETNQSSPRFGMPVMYLIQLSDANQVNGYNGAGLNLSSMYVHWTRIQHVAESDKSCNEWLAIPRQQDVFDYLYDARKISGASGEGFWKSAFSILSVETNPNLGGDVAVNEEATKRTLERLQNSLQRGFLGKGLSLKSVAPDVKDPNPHLDSKIKLICITKGWPKRIFEGSERGELASSQDEQEHIERMENRQTYYLCPRLVGPFVNRVIEYGLVRPPQEGFYLNWPSMKRESEKDRAQVFLTRTQAYGAAMSTGVIPNLFSEKDVMTKLDNLPPREADAIIKNAADAVAQQQEEQMAQEQERMQAMADTGMVDPALADAGLTPEEAAQAKTLAPEPDPKEKAFKK